MKASIGSTHNGPPPDAAIQSAARAIFTAACSDIPSARAARLARARHVALAARPSHIRLPRWAPLASAAACCVLVAGIVWMHPALHTAAPTTDTGVTDTADVLPDVASNQIDMVQNLDFYRWLATQPGATAAASGSGQ